MISKILKSLLIVVLLAQVAHACTAFVVYRNGLALAGNNEDFWETDTKIWFVPKKGSERGVEGKFGRVYFGFNNFFPQGGMNEAGLFFDGFATEENKVKNSVDKPGFDGNVTDYVMANCSTVAEVIAVFEKYDLSFLANAMLMFGDQHGDSVIIEGDELLRIEGDHQVVTNFYQSQTTLDQCNCQRFKTAVQALGRGEPASVESCRDILASTRQNGGAPTQYSNVYDLKNGLVYLYHFHNFEEVVCINLREELEKGAHEIDLPTLFSKKDEFDAFKKQRRQEMLDQVETRWNKQLDTNTFDAYEGTYSFEVGEKENVIVKFVLKGDEFYVVSESGDEQERIYPESKDQFFGVGDNVVQTYQFRRDEANKIIEVVVKIEALGRTFHGVKQAPAP